MKQLLFAVLVAVPTALVTWVFTRGALCPQPSTETSVVAAPAQPTDSKASLKEAFAAPLPGVQLRGDVAYYDEKGLFDYIDGAAPLYIQHGFVRLAAAEMAVAGGSELTCDVYAMADAKGAAALFAAEGSKQARPLAIGDEARASKLAVAFRRGAYYVKLTAFDATAEAALPAIAEALAPRLK